MKQMMSMILAASFVGITSDRAEAGQKESVAAAVRAYVAAGDKRDVGTLDRMMHGDFRVVVTMGASGEVSTMSKADYLGLMKAKKIGGDARTVELEWSKPSGNIAFAKATLRSDKATFDSLFTLVRKDGKWIVISDAVRLDVKS